MVYVLIATDKCDFQDTVICAGTLEQVRDAQLKHTFADHDDFEYTYRVLTFNGGIKIKES